MADAGTSGRRIRRYWPVIVAVVLVLVGVAAFAAPFTFAKPNAKDQQRQQVVKRAEDFAATMNTFDVKDLDGYQKRMKSMLTKAYAKQFAQVTGLMFPELEKTNLTRGKPNVRGVAVKSLGSNTAKAIVAVDAKQTSTDAKDKRESTTRHFRWTVDFKEVSGDWLVDGYDDVGTLNAELEKPSSNDKGDSGKGGSK